MLAYNNAYQKSSVGTVGWCGVRGVADVRGGGVWVSCRFCVEAVLNPRRGVRSVFRYVFGAVHRSFSVLRSVAILDFVKGMVTAVLSGTEAVTSAEPFEALMES